jgi:hypothetical protein
VARKAEHLMPMFDDWRQAMREVHYLNAINRFGPQVNRIARNLRVKQQIYYGWLTSATYRWPIYEDDRSGVYLGKAKK